MSYPLKPDTLLQGGAFRIGDMLGRGSFGITYRATDTTLSRPVAIKELFPIGVQRNQDGVTVTPARDFPAQRFEFFRAGFIEEGKMLAALDHPAIVPVYRVFEENSTAYLVMKLLAGQTVEAYFEEQISASGASGLPWETAVGLIRSLENVITYLHNQEILHRDIKPANLFRLNNGQVILLDFGAARGYLADQTQTMTFIGTRGFAPPEQSEKRARRGPFTDVYALSATLYYLLTGEAPMNSVIRLQEDNQPAPHELVPTIPDWLSVAVMRGLAPLTTQRPQTMVDLCALLTPVVSEPRPIAIPTPQPRLSTDYLSRIEELVNASQDDSDKVYALASVAATWAKTEPRKAEETFQKVLNIANDKQRDALLGSDFALGTFAFAWAKSDPKKALQIADAIDDGRLKVYALASVAATWAKTEPQKAEETFQKALHIANAIENDSDQARALEHIVRAWAKSDPQKALNIANAIERDSYKASALKSVAVAWAKSDPQKALQILDTIKDDSDKVYVLASVAATWAKTEPQKAEETFQKALHIANAIEDDSSKVSALENLARAWAKSDPKKALQILDTIKDGSDKVYALADIALAWEKTDPQKAEETFQKVLNIANAIEDDFGQAYALADIALAWEKTDPQKALQIANTIQSDYFKPTVLNSIASTWVKSDAHAVLQYALSLSGELRDQMIFGIARGLDEMVNGEDED